MCPNCGSLNSKSNLINETPFRKAAGSAAMLRQFGHSGAAADVLIRLASVRIINFLRLKRCCQDCGVTYDA